MTRFFELLISVLIVCVLFVLVGVALPDKRSLKHSVETSHPLRQAFDTLNSFKRFGDWNPLRQHDPQVVYRLSGPERGAGARLDYQSERSEIGSGSWQIAESVQDQSIRYDVQNAAYGENKHHRVNFTKNNKIVEIDWEYSVEYGWSLPGRYAGFYVDRTVGDDVKRGLNNIANLLASMPSQDYSALEIQTTAIAPQNILYISKSPKRNFHDIEAATFEAIKALRAAIAENKLVEIGRPRLITTNFGTENYEFDIAIPVAHEGEGVAPEQAAQAPAAAEEGEDAAEPVASDEPPPGEFPLPTADQVDLAAPAPLGELKLPEDIKTGVSYGGRVLVIHYTGHPAALPQQLHPTMRSYAAAHGEVIRDRVFDEQLTEMQDTEAARSRYRVYWPIR